MCGGGRRAGASRLAACEKSSRRFNDAAGWEGGCNGHGADPLELGCEICADSLTLLPRVFLSAIE